MSIILIDPATGDEFEAPDGTPFKTANGQNVALTQAEIDQRAAEKAAWDQRVEPTVRELIAHKLRNDPALRATVRGIAQDKGFTRSQVLDWLEANYADQF